MATRRNTTEASLDAPVAKRLRKTRSVQQPLNSDPSRALQGSGSLINEAVTRAMEAGTQANTMSRNALSMDLSEPDLSESKKASASAKPLSFTLRDASKPAIPASWVAQREAGKHKHFVWSTAETPSNRLKLIGANQVVPRLQHVPTHSNDSSVHQSTMAVIQTWITTTSHWWATSDQAMPVPPIASIKHLIIHCNGGMPMVKTPVKTPYDTCITRFPMPRHQPELHVTVYVNDSTTNDELLQFLASLPLVYRQLHLVGPWLHAIPFNIRSNTVIFWDAIQVNALLEWVKAESERFEHVAIRFHAACDPDSIPPALAFACKARYSFYVSVPPPAAPSAVAPPSAPSGPVFAPALILEKRHWSPHQRLLCYNDVTSTHQCMLAVQYQDDLKPEHLRALWLKLEPYDRHPETLNTWKQHLALLFMRIGACKSVVLDMYLRIPEECAVWLIDVLALVLHEVYHARRKRRGRLILSPFWAISGDRGSTWADWVKGVYQRLARPTYIVDFAAYSVPMEHDLSSLGAYMESLV